MEARLIGGICRGKEKMKIQERYEDAESVELRWPIALNLSG